MQTARLAWTWHGKTLQLNYDIEGEGETILLLPALSSISTRREMRPLQERLSRRYRTVTMDWPGFGALPRPDVDWRPEAYSAFLAHVIETIAPSPYAVVAAGHAATYVLAHACAQPGSVGRLILIAPTWRGPLPTMMNGRKPFFERLCRLVDLPLIGPLLYRLNVNRVVIRFMAAGHVYADREWLRGERLREKLAVTHADGARFASIRFVTGALDPVATREQFLDLARHAGVPVLALYGVQTPPRSRAEIEALIAIPDVQSVCLPRGKLAIHEEFPDLVVPALERFLSVSG
jgi:pimeloyl-ACP methyl ester carboxylesterase